MSTVPRLKLGPADHDRPLTFDEFMAADYAEGYEYELIRGRLYVSPFPNMPSGYLETWIFWKLKAHSVRHPEALNAVFPGGRVFVPEEAEVTAPEPDVVAYRDFRDDIPIDELRWQDFSPVLVVEVLSEGNPEKDLVRNVELYLLAPSIREYWIIDGLENANRPTLKVHRRHGKRWVVREYTYGETYTTKLLPGFELVIDPRR
ncbi:MAG: Uma2 family endonuclease [Gemmataceae bacterium]